MDRLERLLNLVAALLDTERVLTAEEIGTRVPGFPAPGTPAFHRAFERDKATLREMGVPLEVVIVEPSNPESAHGYRIRPDRYELPDPGLSAEEVAALHLAATQVRLEGGDATAAIWKLGGVPTDPDAGTGVLERAATAAIPGSDHLAGLFAATAERRSVTFPYKGDTRRVEPWRLEFRNGSWYLVGLDTDRDGRRTFRLDRIEGPVAAGEPRSFERPETTASLPTHPWEMGDEEPVEVDVLIDADQAAWAVTTTGGAATVTERRADGAVVVRLRVTNRAALRSWVIGFLDHAEILGPSEERDALLDWLTPVAGLR
ncbi:MAG: hypothetical protein NVSMB12_03270 [Acidimicrobiales bacterium]